MDSKELALTCHELADAKKAENIVILDMRTLTPVTDYFVICTGTSEPHVRAIVDEMADKLRTHHQQRPRAIDGTLPASWIVLDYLDVMVHVMRAESRERYNLEGLWGDAPRVKPRSASRTRRMPTVAGGGSRVTGERKPTKRRRPEAEEQAGEKGAPVG
jgi:ribosome-associated protein